MPSSNAGREPLAFSGARLKARRQGQFLSVTELGFRVGRSADTIRAYESGNAEPPARILALLVHELRCGFDDLYVPAPPTASAS